MTLKSTEAAPDAPEFHVWCADKNGGLKPWLKVAFIMNNTLFHKDLTLLGTVLPPLPADPPLSSDHPPLPL